PGMKRLLCRGSGSIFQLSHVFRQAEVGAQHSEEFHLLEWYRLCDPAELRLVQEDVERLVAAVFEAAGRAPPTGWLHVQFLNLLAERTGLSLRGDEDAEALLAAAERAELDIRAYLPGTAAMFQGAQDSQSSQVAKLYAWTELFSSFCDLDLDAWLESRGDVGVHIGGFPAALAALSECSQVGSRALAHRFESHVAGVELANGYRELRDPMIQANRFAVVNGLRRHLGQASLPIDKPFISDLTSPGLPACAGVALGLDRLIMLAAGKSRLTDVSLDVSGVNPGETTCP
ncbi:MAG: amino acid--tRNA ligase-related protein, partial [Nannocystaceae bacterium]